MARSEPRRHHILPVFFLAGFTDTGQRTGKLHVHDYFRNRRYRAGPVDVANERDFYRVYEPNEDPFVVEKDLARLEAMLSAVLRRVVAAGAISGRNDLGAVLSFVALTHARGRKGRERLSKSMQQTMAEKLRAGLVTAAQWEAMTEAEVRAGVPRESIPSLAEAKRLVWITEWQPEAPEVLKTGLIGEVQDILLPSLEARTWSLAKASPDSGGFICSDSPLQWGARDPWDRENAHARIDDVTQPITFPLTKDLALITRDDGRPGTYLAVPHVVAWVNARTHLGSLGVIYSSSEDFLLLRADGLGHGLDYFAYVEEMRRRGVVNP
ncbi:MAG: DUF4238 domain-containing protein [Actinomycetota bacterium]|nr:DUF4238 domain-containing protein [Actinomycetota bacterium]